MTNFFTTLDRKSALSPATVVVLLCLARPLLRLLLVLYKRDVARAQFPEDEPVFLMPGPGPGPEPDRLLFIGDVTVSGYGVLHHGMTTVSHTAGFVGQYRGRGCIWATMAASDLTAARVARLTSLGAVNTDAVLIMLGIPDVLVATSSVKWAGNLREIANQIRREAAPGCRILIAAIPPMGDFRPISAFSRKALTLQLQQLNRATQQVASETSDTVFVPFPEWRIGDMYVEDLFSWKTMHEKWGRVLATATSQALDDKDRRSPDSKGGRGSPLANS